MDSEFCKPEVRFAFYDLETLNTPSFIQIQVLLIINRAQILVIDNQAQLITIDLSSPIIVCWINPVLNNYRAQLLSIWQAQIGHRSLSIFLIMNRRNYQVQSRPSTGLSYQPSCLNIKLTYLPIYHAQILASRCTQLFSIDNAQFFTTDQCQLFFIVSPVIFHDRTHFWTHFRLKYIVLFRLNFLPSIMPSYSQFPGPIISNCPAHFLTVTQTCFNVRYKKKFKKNSKLETGQFLLNSFKGIPRNFRAG